MSIFSNISAKIKEIFKTMLGAKTIESKLNVAVAISPEMEKAINTWNILYRNKAPWLHEPDKDNPVRVVSLGLPSMIASEKARTALLEFKSEITTPTEEVEVDNPDYKNPPDMELNRWGQEVPKIVSPTITQERPKTDTARAEFLNEQYTKLKKQLRKQLEYGIALGGLVIKPYYVTNKDANGVEIPTIEYDFIRADCFYPLAFDANGNITEAAFIQPKVDKDVIYRRLEYHKWVNNTVEIVNKCYKTTRADLNNMNNDEDLGKEVPLTEVPEWSTLKEKLTINNTVKPIFAYFKMPDANIIDLTSPLGVSGYARAVNLIRDADLQYSRLLWEYEAGEMAVNVDRDAFQWIVDSEDSDRGKSRLPVGQQRLYRQTDIDGTQGELFQPFNPTLRDTSYMTGLNAILMRIEDVTGLSRGTISDASAEARTATELKILKQRSYQANKDIQDALEIALKDVIYATNVLCDLYEITPDGEYDVSFEWDDSILVDVEQELNKRILLMQQGLTSKLEVRQWYFGETERQAKEALQQIADESANEAENDLMNQEQFLQNRGE